MDGGSGVNVISTATCAQLGIIDWEPCPFWLRIADTRSVRPLGLVDSIVRVTLYDDFPDADIVRVTLIALQEERNFTDRWLVEMTYFLSTRLPPPQLRMDEKK